VTVHWLPGGALTACGLQAKRVQQYRVDVIVFLNEPGRCDTCKRSAQRRASK
jgi:hypothetical protein